MTEATPAAPQSRPGIYLGRPFRLPVFVHWSFIALSVSLLLIAWLMKGQPGNRDLPILVTCLLGWIIVLGVIQEFAHAIAARLLGGSMQTFVVSAYGGAGVYKTIGGPRQCMTAVSGPAFSFVVACVLAWVISRSAGESFFALLNPLWPPELQGTMRWQAIAKIGAWAGVSLSLVQMLPIWQCDGRAILDGVITTLDEHASAETKRQRSAAVLLVLASLAGGCAVVGAFMEHPQGGVPKWPFVAVIGILLWLSGRRADARTQLLERKDKGIGLRGWLKVRRAQTIEHREAVDASKVDEILDRLHLEGIGSLSSEERAILNRVSAKLQENRNEDAS